MAFASEELYRRGAPTRSVLSGDDEYLRQLNRITDQTIGSIERSGDALARSEENRWRGINEGVNNAFDTYRDVSRQKRQEGREDKADQLASEEREFQRGRQITSDEREGQRLAADLGNMELQKRIAEGTLADSEEARAWNKQQAVDAKGKPLVGPDSQPITNAQQSRIMAQQAQQSQIDQAKSGIALNNAQLTAANYAYKRQQGLDRTQDAIAPLKQALATNDPNALNKTTAQLTAMGASQYEIARAQDLAMAELRASANQAEAQLWLKPGYREAADQISKVKRASEGVKALEDLKANYIASLKTRGAMGIGKEDDISADYRNQAAGILRDYFNNPEAAHTLETNWTTGGTIKDLDKYIKLTSAQVNNLQNVARPSLERYGRDSYISDGLAQIDANLKYQAPDPETMNKLPVWTVTQPATAGQSNAAMVNGLPGMQLTNAQSGQPLDLPLPAQAPQPQQMQPAPQQPAPAVQQPPHPMYKYRVKNGR